MARYSKQCVSYTPSISHVYLYMTQDLANGFLGAKPALFDVTNGGNRSWH
jgi:hypothetical protein